MKVKDLLKSLADVDPELDVCFFDDSRQGAPVVNSIGMYFGVHEVESIKAVHIYDTGNYLGLGCPRNFTHTIPPNLIKKLY